MSTEAILDRLMSDAMAYEPTLQEIRWATIESRARVLIKDLERRGFVGVTGDALVALRELKEILTGHAQDDPAANPQAIIGNAGFAITI